MKKRGGVLLFAPVLITAALFASAAGASAETGKVSAQYQAYSSATGQDPYSNSPNAHVGGYGGQPVVAGYIRLNLESLPTGSTIYGLRLKLVPTSSMSNNVNTGAAAFEACVLADPLTANGYLANPPTYDCHTHAAAEPQSDGSFTIELSPLAAKWTHENTGLALVAYSPSNGTPVGVDPTAWSLEFDRQKTAATIDYAPGSASSSAAYEPQPVIQQQPAFSVAPPPAVAPAAPVQSVVTAPTTAPAAAPSAPVESAPRAEVPTIVERPRLDKQWLWVTGALGAAAVLMVLAGAGQHVLRTGRFNPGAALVAARSQLATPVSVLALAAVFSLGSTTQLVGVAQYSGGTPGAPGAANQAGGTEAGGAVVPGASPGSTTGPSGAGGAVQPGQQASSAGAPGGAAAPGGTNSPLNGPGVTSTTVRIGFIYTVNAQAANAAFGFKTPNEGNQQAEEQALVDYINHHGGIAGRQIQPVYLAYDNGKAESDPTVNTENCHTLTEDYHVFAVIGGGGPPDDADANTCYAQAHTMNFDLEQSEPDLSFFKEMSPYIWLPVASALDRIMRTEIGGLQHQGYFSSPATDKFGVVIAADPVNERVYKDVTLPGIQAAGAKNIEQDFEVPHDTVSDVANTMKQAVARFQLDGVTNVMFQGGGAYGTGSYAALFLVDAESQHYHPRYGLSSDDGPVALTQFPEDSLQDSQGRPALAVGINPGEDTDDAHYEPWPYTANEKFCNSIEAAAGNTSSSRLNGGVALDYCSAMFEFQQGAAPLAGGPLNAQLWADQAMKLGSNVFNDSLYAAYVGPDHWDSVGGYRLLHAVQNCESGSLACFEYDNANVYH